MLCSQKVCSPWQMDFPVILHFSHTRTCITKLVFFDFFFLSRLFLCLVDLNRAIMSTVSANVIRAGRAKNVHCAMMNVKWRIATVTAIVSAANVNVFEATKEPCAKKVWHYHYNIFVAFSFAITG